MTSLPSRTYGVGDPQNSAAAMDSPSAEENEGERVMESGRSGVNEDPFSVSEPITTVGGFSALLVAGGGGHWSRPWLGGSPWPSAGDGSSWTGAAGGGPAGVGQWPGAGTAGHPGGAPWSAAGGQGQWPGAAGAGHPGIQAWPGATGQVPVGRGAWPGAVGEGPWPGMAGRGGAVSGASAAPRLVASTAACPRGSATAARPLGAAAAPPPGQQSSSNPLA